MSEEPGKGRDWLRSLLIFVIVGAVLFFCCGQWAYDTLGNYGFELFGESTFTQDVALITALAIASPAIFLLEYDPMSRPWFALNGALWGCLSYIVWQGIARIRRQRRMRRDQMHLR